LVALLIGLAIGLFIVAGTLTMFASTTRHQASLYDAARFEREIREVLTLVAKDLRRAGYAGLLPNADNNGDGQSNVEDMLFNPFTADDNNLKVGAKSGESANSCVTFSYNLDEDSPPQVGACIGCGSLPSDFTTSAPFDNTNLPFDRDGLEMFGYRLNTGQIETRTGVAAGDTSFDCDAGVWSALTGTEIQVTGLNFALSESQIEVGKPDIDDGDNDCMMGQPCLCAREVTISLSANLATDSLIQRDLVETVRVRNDKFVRSFDTANPCED
jgi:type II secretory pathway component PulJ